MLHGKQRILDIQPRASGTLFRFQLFHSAFVLGYRGSRVRMRRLGSRWAVPWKVLGNEPPLTYCIWLFKIEQTETIALTSRRPRPPQRTRQR